MSTIFTGSCVALVTPFTADNQVDLQALERLLDFQLENGTNAILVCGTTGEPSTMTSEEEQEVIRFTVKKVNHRVPVIVGTGSNDTVCAIQYSKTAEELGADALLLVTPYYNKTTQKGLIAHYTAIADSVNLPLILYNVPGRTGLNMLPATVAKLAQHKNIQAVKEASGNVEQMLEIAALTRGLDFDIYSGEDSLNVPIMAMGGVGAISVVANIAPAYVSNMCAAVKTDVKKAAELQVKILDLCKAMFLETNPIPVKTALHLMGFAVGGLRMPLVDMEEGNLEKMRQVMKKHGLLA